MSSDNFETRKKEFHDKLSELIHQYPELYNPEPCQNPDCDCALGSGYDPTSPKFILGHVLIFTYENMDRYGSLVWTVPDHQNYHMTVGMVKKAYENI